MKQSFFNYNFTQNFDLENYFVGNANIDAFNILIKEGSKNNQFLLIGPNKSGKTHLGLIWKNKFESLEYNNNFNEIINKKENVLIDNLYFQLNEEEIFHIINHCNLFNLKILITIPYTITDYNFKFNDLSSRLKTFYNIKIKLPDDELLLNLMIKLFHDKQIIVKNPEIFNYIVKRVNRSYDNVFKLINNIDKLLLTTNKQLTIPLIKELI